MSGGYLTHKSLIITHKVASNTVKPENLTHTIFLKIDVFRLTENGTVDCSISDQGGFYFDQERKCKGRNVI